MQRLNFTLDDQTVKLLDELSDQKFAGNKSQTVRAALESLAAHNALDGWVVTGYSMIELEHATICHHCGVKHARGAIMYRPVFERGRGAHAVRALPAQSLLDCQDCAQSGHGCVQVSEVIR